MIASNFKIIVKCARKVELIPKRTCDSEEAVLSSQLYRYGTVDQLCISNNFHTFTPKVTRISKDNNIFFELFTFFCFVSFNDGVENKKEQIFKYQRHFTFSTEECLFEKKTTEDDNFV